MPEGNIPMQHTPCVNQLERLDCSFLGDRADIWPDLFPTNVMWRDHSTPNKVWWTSDEEREGRHTHSLKRL